MEIRELKSRNSYDDVEIKCPYCFNTFYHNEVGFRVNPVSEEQVEEYRRLSLSSADEKEIDKYDNLYKNAQKYQKKQDKTWLDYWSAMGWDVQNGQLFENGDGYDEYDGDARPSELSRLQDPVIGLNNDMLIGEKHVDGDGFVESAVDSRGEVTTRRICPHCHNKLPKAYGKHPVKFVAVVGISGSGKTVMLSQLLENIETYVTNAGAKVTFDESDAARKFTQQYKINPNVVLPEGTKPHFVPPIFLQMSRKDGNKLNKWTVVIYDIAGESCVAADGLDKFGPFVRNSDGIILLLDPKQINEIDFNDEQLEDSNDVKPKATSVLNTMAKAFVLDEEQVCDVPLAVTYSKSDMFQGVDGINENSHMFKTIDYRSGRGFRLDAYNNIRFEVESLLKRYNNVLHQNVLDLFSTYGFFAFTASGHKAENVGGVGSKKQRAFMMNLEPKRVEEPFLWLLYKWGMIEGVKQPGHEEEKGLFSLLRRR